MQAEIIAVGTELLSPSKVDTNSLYLAKMLAERGILLARKSVVGDERDLLASEIRRARESSRVVILSGGLGPTLDDLTREAASDATGRDLVLHESIVREIERRFRALDRPMAEVNKRQAYILEGAEILPNPRGTAPGQWLKDDRGILILLPGPPRELEPLFEAACLPRLDRHLPAHRYFTLTLRVAGIGESDIEQRIGPIYAAEGRVVTTLLSAPGDVQIHLRAQADDEDGARAITTGLGDRIRAELGTRVYSENGASLEATVASILREKGGRLAVAESITGGLLAGALTAVPGSSEFFAGGITSYADAAKRDWLGIDAGALSSAGAVSAEVAEAMAQAARRRAADALGEPAWGVSTTGYAGPGGGTERDPVGTVYLGIADASGCRVHRRSLGRERNRVRTLAVRTALDLLRRRLLGVDDPR